MKCMKCSKEAEIPYPNGDVCKGCFVDILVKRVKKDVRMYSPFSKGDKILVFGRLTFEFLKKVVEDLPVDIDYRNAYSKELSGDYSSYDKVVIPWTADDEAAAFYEELTKKRPTYSVVGHGRKVIKLFKPVLVKELKVAAGIMNISYEPSAPNKDVEKIHKKYPSSTFGLVKSASDFKKAVK